MDTNTFEIKLSIFFGKLPSGEKNIDSLISKVFVSITRDTLDLERLDVYIIEEFERNKIDVNYALQYNYKKWFSRDSIVDRTINFKLENVPDKHIKTISKSTYLPHRSRLELLFTNAPLSLLRDSFISIFLSFLLSMSIIASLIYLLKTIYKQNSSLKSKMI